MSKLEISRVKFFVYCANKFLALGLVTIGVGCFASEKTSDTTGDTSTDGIVIESIDPAQAASGEVIKIIGNGFGSEIQDGEVTIGGIPSEIFEWTESKIQVTVPVVAAVGANKIAVAVNGNSSEAEFTVTEMWRPTSLEAAPSGREYHSAIWTGEAMLIWGGSSENDSYFDDGASYQPSSDTWSNISAVNAPEARSKHSAIWTGDSMLIWGGESDFVATSGGGTIYRNTGARYFPDSDSWSELAVLGAPTPRTGHSAIWTGSEMVIWGGEAGGSLNDGARYDPVIDAWSPVTSVGAPSARTMHASVWTGSQMIVWGGLGSGSYNYLADGAAYNPNSDEWTSLSLDGAPEARYGHAAVWTGQKMIVWGGIKSGSSPVEYYSSGGVYDPATESWSQMTSTDGPGALAIFSMLWADDELLIVGALDENSAFEGWRYDIASDNWKPIVTVLGPGLALWGSSAVWAGDELILWGGGLSIGLSHFVYQDGYRWTGQ